MFDFLDHREKQRLRDFVSGLIAGVISVTVCNPLDIARTRLNLMSSLDHRNTKYKGFVHALRTIYREEGMKGYFTGYQVNVKAIPIFHAIFFPIYETIKEYCRKKDFSKSEEYLTSAIVAGSFCNFVTNPIWVVRTRVMAQALHPEYKQYQSNNMTVILKQMVHEEGVGSLFKGVSASVLGVSNAVIYFYIYENFREKFAEKKNHQFNSYYVLFSSILAKFIASSITYPFIVTRTIMQDDRNSTKQVQSKGMAQVVRQIYNKKGVSGFYTGLKPDLVRLLPSNTIVFLVYQFMKRHIHVSMEGH